MTDPLAVNILLRKITVKGKFMRTLWALFTALSVSMSVSVSWSVAAVAAPYVPGSQDLEFIRAELSTQMLDPASTIISDVLANDELVDGKTMTWICGKVRGRNTFGGYAQPVPFLGAIVESPVKGRTFITISIADARTSVTTLQSCLVKMQ